MDPSGSHNHRELDDKLERLLEDLKGVDGRLNVLDEISAKIERHDQRFDRIDKALADHYQRINGIDHRIDRMEARLGGLDVRMADIELQLEGIGVRLDASDERLDNIEHMNVLMLRALYDLAKGVQAHLRIDFDPDAYLPEVAEQLRLPEPD